MDVLYSYIAFFHRTASMTTKGTTGYRPHACDAGKISRVHPLYPEYQSGAQIPSFSLTPWAICRFWCFKFTLTCLEDPEMPPWA